MFDYIPAKDSPRKTMVILLDATPSDFPSQLKEMLSALIPFTHTLNGVEPMGSDADLVLLLCLLNV